MAVEQTLDLFHVDLVESGLEGRDRARPGRQLNRYFIVQIVGALSNYLVYAQILSAYDASTMSAAFGFVIGSLLGTVINFTGMRYLVFKT